MCAKFIPKLLTREQKDLCSEMAQDSLEMVSDDENVLKKVITGDESWVYGSRRATAEKSTSKSEPASLQSENSYLRLLDVPKIENGAQRKAVRRHRDDSE